MSGICGIIHFDGAPVAVDALERMVEAAAHRGPDGVGYWCEGAAGLAHLALRITPEEQQEVQPLVSECGELVIVADARIDNREELIRALRARDGLRTHAGGDPGVSDAALLLAAFRAWGRDCAARLVGDFAFVIWDSRRRRVFAARDAMAMRALYFRKEPNRLLFGTEVKQILGAPGVPRRLFEPAVAAHLAGQFASLASTFYEGITQLEPGHALEAGVSTCRTFRFWDVDPEIRIRYRDEREYAEHFREVFKEAVRCRLRSSRPVGIFLSGGMDSGSIASTAGWLLRHEDPPCPLFRTYSWAFDELSECDERHISSGIVRHYGFEATDISADAWWPLRDYPDHGPDQDEPFVGIYQALIERTLAAAQSDGVGVMMSGDRGDLMMGEYIYDYTGLFWSGQWRTMLRELQMQGRWRGTTTLRMIDKFLLKPLRSSLWPPGRADWLRRSIRNSYWMVNGARPPLYPEWVRADFAARTRLDERDSSHKSRRIKFQDAVAKRYDAIFAPMHMRGMVWSERSYARFGQAFADPWSDRRIAEFAMAVPQRVLNRTGDEKRLVRSAMRDIMPDDVLRSVEKVPLTPLYEQALRNGAVQTVDALLTGSQLAARGYVLPHVLRDHYDSIRKGQPGRPGFWLALTLEMWLRRYWS